MQQRVAEFKRKVSSAGLHFSDLDDAGRVTTIPSEPDSLGPHGPTDLATGLQRRSGHGKLNTLTNFDPVRRDSLCLAWFRRRCSEDPQKLGQPAPLSNLVPEANRSRVRWRSGDARCILTSIADFVKVGARERRSRTRPSGPRKLR